MSKILYWNIDKFPGTANGGLYGTGNLGTAPTPANQLNYVLAHVTATDPDIFIIVEPVVADGAPGTLVDAGVTGGLGITLLRASLQGGLSAGSDQWAVVPPLRTGIETVAVYFRQDRLIFSGPFGWPGGGAGPSLPYADCHPAAAYPVAWPMDHTQIPNGSEFNPDAYQDVCAAAVSFVNSAVPPVAIDYGHNTRPPFQTTFFEIATGRSLNIFTVHGPASNPAATAFIAQLAATPEITRALRANEIRLILGDFNINLLGAGNLYSGCYNPLEAPALDPGYDVALMPAPAPGAPPDPLYGYKGYVTTSLATVSQAASRCFSSPTVPQYYPAYGYSNNATPSIDNVLSLGADVTVATLTVINPIVGSIYRDTTAPRGQPVDTPYGSQAFPARINWAWNGRNPAAPLAPDIALQRTAWTQIEAFFGNVNNYGLTRGVSDHLALVFEF